MSGLYLRGGKGLSWEQAHLVSQSIWGWEVPGELLGSSAEDDGREGGSSRLFWARNKENPSNLQALPQIQALARGTAPAEEAQQGGAAGQRYVLLVGFGGFFLAEFAGFLLLFGVQGLPWHC